MTDIEKTTSGNGPTTPTKTMNRWDPFAEFENWFGRTPTQRWPWAGLWSAADGIDFTPAADIEESDDSWTIEVELPGVAKRDVEVESYGRTVVIRGERKEKERTGVLRQRRRVSGTFRYEVTLPGDVDFDAIEARLDDGELTVTIPKSMAEQPRKIKVN